MDPKFQSSFIPKGPAASSGVVSRTQSVKHGTFLGLFSKVVFVLSIVSALLVFGYGFYLKSNLTKMGEALETARTNLEPEKIKEVARLDARIVGVEKLLTDHTVFLPLFDFLENNTLKAVRFTQFSLTNSPEGFSVSVRGQARGYAALALQADLLNKSQNLKSVTFSNLDLDERGNVTFALEAMLDSALISYKRLLETTVPISSPVTPATSTVPVATSTPAFNATSTDVGPTQR